MSLENDVHIYDGTKLDWKKNDNFDNIFCSKILKNLMFCTCEITGLWARESLWGVGNP